MMPRMKTKQQTIGIGFLALLMGVLGAMPSVAGQVISLGARYHEANAAFTTRPFSDGDISYCAAYEFHDQNAFWQLGVDVTPEVGDGDAIDYGVTPQLNLLFKDRIFQGGLGILSTYTRDAAGQGDWMDMYWQFILGIALPLPGRLKVSANAYYPFEKWDSLGEFKSEDIEYGVAVGYTF